MGALVPLGDLMPRSLTFPRPGLATAVHFSPDGSGLAGANETAGKGTNSPMPALAKIIDSPLHLADCLVKTIKIGQFWQDK